MQNSKYNRKLTVDDYKKMVIFATLWGVAGSFELNARKKYEDLLRRDK